MITKVDHDIAGIYEEEAYFMFRPRPDQPERYDQQKGFYDSQTHGVAWLIGGNGAGTTEVALAKIAKFVLRNQPPPRKDTPFWIISGTYEQTMAVAWKEKLYGHGHIPGSEVDWDRVRWYRPNQEWPFEIPLKPWPDLPGKNWTLVFKSYEQGRASLQAQSIGGFCFIEQFPWGLLEEVLRGCRDYNFPGSKFCEFTPIDPNLSVEIEEMIQNGSEPEESEKETGFRYLPKDWEIYRANTQCALDAGHVKATWFDEFFGMVSDEMIDARMIGEFPSFVGQIYTTFNPLVHVVGDDVIDFPTNIFHRRGIDWGGGPSNAFCCLWAYRNGIGQWFIYDEYYSTEQTFTTVDHLCEVCDRWPWPTKNPHFGTTYADPSDPDNIRIAQKLPLYTEGNYDQLDMMKAANAVNEGIEHVRWLLKLTIPKIDVETGEIRMKPRLFIHRKNCPNLSRQMRSYRWLASRQVGINPKDARREPLKKEDHACFSSTAKIETPSGPCPIVDLNVGDEILTHLGIGRVEVGPQRTAVRRLWELILADGRSILCTAEHPIGVSGGRWKRADQCKGMQVDVLLRSWNLGHKITTESSSWNTAVIGGVDTLIPHTTDFDAITEDHPEREKGNSAISGFISGLSLTAMVKSLLEWWYTIRMKTLTIIHSRISNYKHRASIQEYIIRICSKLSMQQNSGTAQKKVANGIANMHVAPLVFDATFVNTVNIAASHTGLKTAESRPVFATLIAKWQHDANSGKTSSREHAKSVANHSIAIATSQRERARENVEACSVVAVRQTSRIEPVFSIATSDGTFFVDGILVSNCDALRYIVFSEAMQQGLTPSSMKREDRSRQHGVHLNRR